MISVNDSKFIFSFDFEPFLFFILFYFIFFYKIVDVDSFWVIILMLF